MPASADVIYSNLQNIEIPATFDGLYLNVETGAWNTDMAAPVAGWDINPYYGGKVLGNSPAFQPVRSGTGSSSPVVNLAAGTSVGTGSVFSTFFQGAGGETLVFIHIVTNTMAGTLFRSVRANELRMLRT